LDYFNRIKTFSRGGSDLTGAIIASFANASVYENWTDVDGFYTADPRKVPSARPQREMTYEEVSILSYAGSNVLHEDTMTILQEHNITLHIRNTNNPEAPGTKIVPMMAVRNKGLVGVVGQEGFTVINIIKIGAHKMKGFGAGILDTFVEFGISYSYELLSGRDNSKFAIKSELLEGVDMEALQNRIKEVVNPKTISFSHNIGVINAIMYNPTDFTDTLLVLERNSIPIKTKGHDDDTGQVIITLPEDYVNKAVCLIHDRFYH
jgi:aspartate kinase